MLKSSACSGCPFEHYGQHFCPDTIVPGSKVMFIGQGPGANEISGQKLIKRHYLSYGKYEDETVQVQPQPLIGSTGNTFNSRFLPLSGLSRAEVSIGNALRCRPGADLGLKHPDDLPPITSTMKLDSSRADIVKALKHCRDAYLHIPPSVQLIVTMGRYAMFALTGIQSEEREYGKKQGVVESWRGYGVDLPSYSNWSTVDTSTYHPLTSNTKVLFTMHIAALTKGAAQGEYADQAARGNKQFMHATLEDFGKIKRLLAGEWPKPLPTWKSTPPLQWPKYSAFDTEYIPDTNQLIRWSLCDTDYQLYCVESDNTPYGNIPVQQGSTVIIQNALADISYLSNITDLSAVSIEDLMLADAVLWTGEPHNLNYINSKYGAFNRYKHLISVEEQEQLYSALDAYEPMYAWKNHYIPQFKADPLSWRVYKKQYLPLIHIINKAQLTGAKVDTSRLTEVQQILQQRLQQYQDRAREITGNASFNLGGRKELMEQIYG